MELEEGELPEEGEIQEEVKSPPTENASGGGNVLDLMALRKLAMQSMKAKRLVKQQAAAPAGSTSSPLLASTTETREPASVQETNDVVSSEPKSTVVQSPLTQLDTQVDTDTAQPEATRVQEPSNDSTTCDSNVINVDEEEEKNKKPGRLIVQVVS